MNHKVGKVDVITMGCSKNLIDSERLMAMLEGTGITVRHNPERVKADVAVVNTCGFIGDAKEESIEMILEMTKAKQEGLIKSLFVMGCLSQRYPEELKESIPEVDGWYGKFDWPGIVRTLKGDDSKIHRPWDRVVTTRSHSAYVKISEGCNRRCAFCAIPLITGPHHSREVTEILEEVRTLARGGTKEFNIIAQDLSSYGMDLTHRQLLPELIDSIADIPGVEWIRLHYAYPAQFPREVLKVMAQRENVCSYLDIALQHISDPVLSNMRRNISAAETRDLIAEIRETVPGIHLRTTLMVGFPGEGEKEFDELMDFVAQTRFERMGAFAYCEEEGTWGAKKFIDNIPADEKQRRLDAVMALQQDISDDIQQGKIGKTFNVLIDEKENEYYVGRTEWDSPEVDPVVLIKSDKKIIPGEFYNVKVNGATPFELYGNVEQ